MIVTPYSTTLFVTVLVVSIALTRPCTVLSDAAKTAVAGWPVRVLLSGPALPTGGVEGFLVDLSEGGLRVRIKEWPGGEGVPVAVRLVLPDGAGDGMDGGRAAVVVAAEELRGTALRAVGAHGGFVPGGAADVHVQFEGSVGCADELRALVFAWQRAARRAGQDS